MVKERKKILPMTKQQKIEVFTACTMTQCCNGIKNIDPNATRTIRSLVGAIGIPRNYCRMKRKQLKVHTMS
jgi:hypothetical protein